MSSTSEQLTPPALFFTGTPRHWLLLAILLPAIVLAGAFSAAGSTYSPETVSYRQTLAIYQSVPCLTSEERAYGSEVIRGLTYTDRRIFRLLCTLPGVSFTGCQQAWSLLIQLNLSYAQVRCFETWSSGAGVDFDQALAALPAIRTLQPQAGNTWLAALSLPGSRPDAALGLIPIFNDLDDTVNLALQGLLHVDGMNAAGMLDVLPAVVRLRDNQARAAEAFAGIAGMDLSGVTDALPLIGRLDQNDAWTARCLFRRKGMAPAEAWNWLVVYFAHPRGVQERQYLALDPAEKGRLLDALYFAGEVLAWRINNLHTVTDRFGMEISGGRLRAMPAAELVQLFDALSPRTRSRFEVQFHASMSQNRRGEAVSLLREATANDRHQVARELTTANLYALLARGGDLFDSSYRDILVPVFRSRLQTAAQGNLLTFLDQFDPDGILISDAVLGLAQRGKLAALFPAAAGQQEQILDLVTRSIFASEETLLLFSFSHVRLLQILSPQARSHLLRAMVDHLPTAPPLHRRLMVAILEHCRSRNPDLLAAADREAIDSTVERYGSTDLRRYQSAPFDLWTADLRLAALSIYHPDDDGARSFAGNGRELLRHGYSLTHVRAYSRAVDENTHAENEQLVRSASATGNLAGLFYAMARDGFAVTFSRTLNGIEISQQQAVYQDADSQLRLLQVFFSGNDEVLAQRGHSYWREEQLNGPLEQLLAQRLLTTIDLQRFPRLISLGSCGGVRDYARLSGLFGGEVDIFATIGTGLASVNTPYNRLLLETIAGPRSGMDWETVAAGTEPVFTANQGREYLQPGSLTAILHKMLETHRRSAAPAVTHSTSTGS